jgi:hypothetical protein
MVGAEGRKELPDPAVRAPIGSRSVGLFRGSFAAAVNTRRLLASKPGLATRPRRYAKLAYVALNVRENATEHHEIAANNSLLNSPRLGVSLAQPV